MFKKILVANRGARAAGALSFRLMAICRERGHV
jgi:hypothetical protein